MTPNGRWEENIILNLREIGRNGADRINLATDRDKWHTLVNRTCNEPSGSIKCRKFLDYLRNYWLFKVLLHAVC